MIALTLRAEICGLDNDTVFRARSVPIAAADATIQPCAGGAVVRSGRVTARLTGVAPEEIEGDVLLLQPERGIVQRLIRARSPHNTFLVTERCDQLCLMCSQPPKKTHVDMFAHFSAAAMLAPEHATIGLSGGEPTLYKAELFRFLDLALTLRPDLKFHVLTNGQHFDEADIDFLSSEPARRILWGVPLYSTVPATHDRIVAKSGAWDRLMSGLSVLCRAAAPLELRTVVLQDNIENLPDLAAFIATHVPFADPWAIMQLENIGFAKNRWTDLFVDHSRDFAPIARALDFARLKGIPTTLYNFPLCTVPTPYRRFAPSTISDWKRRYDDRCEGCIGRKQCGGFFEWHPFDKSYERIGL